MVRPVSRAASARLFAVEEPVTYASAEAVTIMAMAPHVVVIADSDPELFLIVMWPDAPHSLDSFLSTSDAMPEGDLRALLVDAGMSATVIDRVIAEARSQPR